MKGIRQHEPLRVPNGWNGQEKGLIIQLERIIDNIFKLFGRLKKSDLSEELRDQIDSAVTDVGYNGNTQKLTQTINGTTSDIVRVATLDNDGKIPANQLPSYVDDIKEYADLAHFPATGEEDKIYVAKDTGFTYRWSGTQYVRLNTYDTATQSASGLMSAADKTKLDGIDTGANKYILPLAANGTRGGVQVGYTASGKNYPVQLSGEKMYVNVPWENTWRGIQNNLTSTSTTDSLSANQGKILNDNKLDKISSSGLGDCGGNGSNRWCKIATLQITGAYVNRPVVFEISRREYGYQRLMVIFASASSTDPEIYKFVTDGSDTTFRLVKSTTSTWILYGYYNEPWGNLTVHRITGSGTNNGVTVTLNFANAGNTDPGGTGASRWWEAAYADSAGAVAWGNVTDKPSLSSVIYRNKTVTNGVSVSANDNKSISWSEDTVSGYTYIGSTFYPNKDKIYVTYNKPGGKVNILNTHTSAQTVAIYAYNIYVK